MVSLIVLMRIVVCVVSVDSYISWVRKSLLVLWPYIDHLCHCLMIDDYGA